MMARWATKTRWSAFTAWHARTEGRLPYWPLDRILDIQRRRVLAIVAHAYGTVPYYREVMDAAGLQPSDFRSADDLAKLPMLTGDQVARDPERFLSRAYIGQSVELRTSGTSGRRRTIHYDPAALFLAMAHGHRQRLVFAHFVERTFGYREMVASRPGSMGHTIRAFYEDASWVPRRIDLARDTLSPAEPFATSVGRVNQFKPDVLIGYGSFLGGLFRRAHAGRVPLVRPKLIVYGGDLMSDRDRSVIEDEMGVPVISTYQAAEALRLGFQCERQRGLHINLDQVTVRAVDRKGDAVEPGGTGEIVISNLTNYATVILNYKLGDVVTLSAGPCDCGRTLPTIERIEGRNDDYIALPDDERMHALVLQAALHRVDGVIQVQIVQQHLRRFLLRVVYIGAADWAHACRHLAAAMRRTLGEDVVVAIERAEVLSIAPSDKVKAVISVV